MLFRAVFWIGIIAFLMPRAGEMGARPDDFSSSGGSRVTGSVVSDFQDFLRDHLAAVKKDIEAAERARAEGAR